MPREVEEENPKSKDGVVSSEQNAKQSEDPFNIYYLINKDKIKNNKEASIKESLEYPLGFTPRENDVENVKMDNQKDNYDGEFENVNNIYNEVNFSSGFNTYKKAGGESMDSNHCRESEGSRKGGSILMLMDELVKVGQTMGRERIGGINGSELLISITVESGEYCPQARFSSALDRQEKKSVAMGLLYVTSLLSYLLLKIVELRLDAGIPHVSKAYMRFVDAGHGFKWHCAVNLVMHLSHIVLCGQCGFMGQWFFSINLSKSKLLGVVKRSGTRSVDGFDDLREGVVLGVTPDRWFLESVLLKLEWIKAGRGLVFVLVPVGCFGSSGVWFFVVFGFLRNPGAVGGVGCGWTV
ncbi:hypothetical protein Tco_1010263 [Tanacetum coccineum]